MVRIKDGEIVDFTKDATPYVADPWLVSPATPAPAPIQAPLSSGLQMYTPPAAEEPVVTPSNSHHFEKFVAPGEFFMPLFDVATQVGVEEAKKAEVEACHFPNPQIPPMFPLPHQELPNQQEILQKMRDAMKVTTSNQTSLNQPKRELLEKINARREALESVGADTKQLDWVIQTINKMSF